VSLRDLADVLRKRWNGLTPELIDFLKSFPQIGDVYIYNKKNDFEYTETGGEWKIYQAIQNSVVHTLELKAGKCYVSVGFVDLQQLLFANITGEGHVEYHGYEMNPICVARAKLILELLKDQLCSDKEILQIWYSTVIEPNAKIALRKACENWPKKKRT